MRLAVVGHGSLDALQKSVEDTFGRIPFSEGAPRRIKNLPAQVFVREHAVYGASNNNSNDLIRAFGPQQLGKVLRVIPFAEARTVKVYFATPPLDDPAVGISKPYRVLSHFLGHEAPGSLHEILNHEGLLTSLTSGMALDTSDFSLFSLTLSLTPKGMLEKDRVLDLMFQWIALLRNQSDDTLSAYHEEMRQIGLTNFRFRENNDPADFCTSAAEQLFQEELDPARILIASNDVSAYDPSVTRAFLERIHPDNCFLAIYNSDWDDLIGGWKTERWYGAKYMEKELSSQKISQWAHPLEVDCRLQAPDLNKYIPTDFSLRCDNSSSSHENEKSLSNKDDLLIEPPKLMIDRPNLRLWHKMDRFWRVPKTFVKAALLSPAVYQSPRSMTLNRIFQRVLNDDLNSYVYDASLAGCSYKVSCTPNGYGISVRGYSEKIPSLLDTLTTRMLSLIEELHDGDPILRGKFDKAKEDLLRETKNYRLDSPHEIANYNSRLLIEESVWYLDNYIQEMEGNESERFPLSMQECAAAAREALTGRVRCEALCMGNVNETDAKNLASVLNHHFLNASRTLSEAEMPRFRSMKLPTREEAVKIFGLTVKDQLVPLIYQELAFTETEENNAVELIMQAGCERDLGYEGMAIIDLITHMAYNSAFNMLRTKEQLGYIVSAHARNTAGGAWGMSIVIQSSVSLPEKLEERCEAWLLEFRKELKEMTPQTIANEASAVAAQFLEIDTKMSQEVSRVWGEIISTEGLSDSLRTPAFDRLVLLADELSVVESGAVYDSPSVSRRKTSIELKHRVLDFFDEYFAATSPKRRVMSARVYSHNSKTEFELSKTNPGVLSTFSEMRHLKQFLFTWPLVPYWALDERINDIPK